MKEADPDEAEEEVAEGDAADGQTALDRSLHMVVRRAEHQEREVLTKLRKHESEVSKVCSAAQELRVKGAQSAVDLRSLVEAADGVERLLDAAEDAELLQREAVSSQVDWPAEELTRVHVRDAFAELKYARVIVLALDAWETALAKGKEQLTAEAAGGAIYSSLGALLRSFRELREAEAQAQASGSAAVQHADLGLAGKDFPLTALRPLSEALLDKALELKGEALQSFRTQLLNDEGQMEMLKDLRVQLPDLQSGEEEAPILLSPITEQLVQQVSLMVLTETPQSELVRLNKLCRSAPNPVGFIAADCLGLASFVFVDYGDAFMCHDKAPDGEDQVCCKNG
eukprot:g7238.t1